MLGPIDAIAISLKKYADFSGRATRSEFWWFQLFHQICFHGSQWVGQTLEMGNIIAGVVNLILILPLLSVQVRRLHDIGWSGWWVLAMYMTAFSGLGIAVFNLASAPLPVLLLLAAYSVFILIFVVFVNVQYFRPSKAQDNKYGPYGSMESSANIAEPRTFVPQEYVPQQQGYAPPEYMPYG